MQNNHERSADEVYKVKRMSLFSDLEHNTTLLGVTESFSRLNTVKINDIAISSLYK